MVKVCASNVLDNVQEQVKVILEAQSFVYALKILRCLYP